MKPVRDLLFYFNGAFVNRENGAHARALEGLAFARSMAERVTVYSYDNHSDWPWTTTAQERFRREFPDVTLVVEKRGRALRMLSKLKVFAISLLPNLAKKLIRLHISGLTPAYDRLGTFDVVLANYVSGVLELNGLYAPTWLVETHDVQFLNAAKRSGRRVSDLKIALKARSEIAILDQSSAILAISKPEANLFRLLCPDHPVFFIPTYQGATQTAAPAATFDYDLAFIGSENPFNVDGIIDFLGRHRDWLATRRLVIAGRVSREPRVIAAAQGMPGVQLIGYVEDLGDLLARSKAAISPVEGTGLKVKLLDAFRAGKPVLASEHSLSGLPGGFESCAFPIEEAAMDRVLDDEDFRRAAEQASLVYASRIESETDVAKLRLFLTEEARHITARQPAPFP